MSTCWTCAGSNQPAASPTGVSSVYGNSCATPRQERRERHRLRPRYWQSCEARVAFEEAGDVCHALGNRVEQRRQPRRGVRAARRHFGRMRQRAHRRQRVVQFVAHHPDGLLPRRRLLPRQFVRDPFDDHEPMRHRVQVKGADEDAIALFLSILVPRHQAVLAASQGSLQCGRCQLHEFREQAAIQACGAVEHAAARGVGKDDALALVEQQDRHRRALQQRVEQQLPLDQFGAFLAQDRAHAVEDGDQVADLVGRWRVPAAWRSRFRQSRSRRRAGRAAPGVPVRSRCEPRQRPSDSAAASADARRQRCRHASSQQERRAVASAAAHAQASWRAARASAGGTRQLRGRRSSETPSRSIRRYSACRDSPSASAARDTLPPCTRSTSSSASRSDVRAGDTVGPALRASAAAWRGDEAAAGSRGRGPPGRSRSPVATRRARCSRFSSSRTLPGQPWASSARSAAALSVRVPP